MNFRDQLKRIRRMLRDPDGNIWSRSLLKTIFNDVQRDMQRKTRVLEQMAVLNYPPRYQMSFIHDFEWQFLTSGESQFFRCLRYHHQADYSFCYKWEAQSDWGASGTIDDVGIQFTHPWEAFMGSVPCVPISIKFPSNFHTMKFIAFDRRPIDYRTKKSIMSCDSSWETRSGTPVSYYREDDEENAFIPYPRPSSIEWDDELAPPSDVSTVYSHDWEVSYVSSDSEKFTREDETNERDYVFLWELDIGTAQEEVMRGMWLFEIGTGSVGTLGQVLYTEDDTSNTELGTIMRRDGSYITQDDGIAIDILGIDNEFLMIYDSEPTDIQDDTDESDFPIFLRKYIEYGVCERAYNALTDGKIKSMSDYWKTRYSIGIEAVKLYCLKRKTDRDYRFVGQAIPARKTIRHATLPSSYPAL
ncbi:MAG: hypothetical protein PHE50_00220 [Dehalococcoidales bacterium]|nr:hypothetical protein [Dehalococcoidales bacterium]